LVLIICDVFRGFLTNLGGGGPNFSSVTLLHFLKGLCWCWC
jgi:hypothetical protein